MPSDVRHIERREGYGKNNQRIEKRMGYRAVIYAAYRHFASGRIFQDAIRGHETNKIAEKAGELKFRYADKKGLPMADAIIAATASMLNTELVTSDPHFDKIKEIKVRNV